MGPAARLSSGTVTQTSSRYMTDLSETAEAMWEVLCLGLKEHAEETNRQTPPIEPGSFDRQVGYNRREYEVVVEIYPFRTELTWDHRDLLLESKLIQRTLTVPENEVTISSTGYRPFVTIDGDEFWRRGGMDYASSDLAETIIRELQAATNFNTWTTTGLA